MRYTLKEVSFFNKKNWRISINEKGEPDFLMICWAPNKPFAELILSYLPPPDQFPRPKPEVPTP